VSHAVPEKMRELVTIAKSEKCLNFAVRVLFLEGAGIFLFHVMKNWLWSRFCDNVTTA
jgi:hypothetical protein